MKHKKLEQTLQTTDFTSEEKKEKRGSLHFNDHKVSDVWEEVKEGLRQNRNKSCSTCNSLSTCQIDTAYIPDWDGTKDYCSRYNR